jgi:hypothetical protein
MVGFAGAQGIKEVFGIVDDFVSYLPSNGGLGLQPSGLALEPGDLFLQRHAQY